MAFRKKRYSRLEQRPADADSWIREYHENRPHAGTYGLGKTAGQTFLDTKPGAQEKQLDPLTGAASSDNPVPPSPSGRAA
ncbi:MAG: hypothetical protein JO150_00015 [Acidobacteriaceae bacterium]|nr:hypothetical protein [Acidobacteriaceae bacterium]